MIPLLQNPSTLLEFDPPVTKQGFFTSPMFIFSLLLIIIIILSATVKGRTANKTIDLVVFSFFSILALMMVFFNFFTDHQQMKWNLNIIWLSPFILMCLVSIVLNKEWFIWFRVVLFFSLLIFAIQIIFPNAFNNALISLELMLAVRCSMRSGFSWNPLSVHLTEI
jgi:hypothetical protein